MAKYKGRVPSDNMIDIRTNRGSPDDRDVYNRKKQEHEDKALVGYLREVNAQLNAPPKPRPDPRTKTPGGELAIGQGMTRGELNQLTAEQAWINKHVSDFNVRKKEGLFGTPLFKHWWAYPNENPANAQFVLDTFKQARAVGYRPASITEQPAPLPMQFKVKQ